VQTSNLKDLEVRGFEPERNQDIQSLQAEKVGMLNKNISNRR